mmetsp:Transcript_16042/g.34682  ORF Transcript_16042/g.34682 Transcript_16042/m.34682 type:complete len:416 (-) Transcript_16042:116-1363(-)
MASTRKCCLTPASLAVAAPKLIDIASPEELWTTKAAEVPLLADPEGLSPPIRWDLLEVDLSANCANLRKGEDDGALVQPLVNNSAVEELEKAENVQDFINNVVGKKKERQNEEVLRKFRVAIGRATVRAGEIASEKRNLECEEMKERAGAALLAAAGRRAQPGEPLTSSSSSSTASTTWPVSAGESTTGTSSEEEQVNSKNMQARIASAAAAARLRRKAESDAMRNASDDIERAAREAWVRREAAKWDAEASTREQQGWGHNHRMNAGPPGRMIGESCSISEAEVDVSVGGDHSSWSTSPSGTGTETSNRQAFEARHHYMPGSGSSGADYTLPPHMVREAMHGWGSNMGQSYPSSMAAPIPCLSAQSWPSPATHSSGDASDRPTPMGYQAPPHIMMPPQPHNIMSPLQPTSHWCR